MNDLIKTLKSTTAEKVKPYDSKAKVIRLEDDTAWVKIEGGEGETPVRKTVDCKPEDIVQIRVSGGDAWITGNSTSPPTDDSATKKLGSKLDGIVEVFSEAYNRIYRGVNNINTLIRESVAGIEVGRVDDEGNRIGGHTLVSPGGMKVFGGDDGDIQLAQIGYGPKDEGGQVVDSPYFAFGKGLSVSKAYGFAVGRYNHDGDYIFSVGRGSQNYPKNAFAITSLGDIEINGKALTADQDLTLSNEFTWYSQDPSAPPAAFVRRFGNSVTLQGIVCPSSTITGGVAQHTICTIPDGIGCRPFDKEVVAVMQGTGEMRWCLRVKSNGAVTFSRAEKGGAYVNVDDTTWLPFCITYNSNYI